MGTLRNKMIDAMRLRRFSLRTEEAYLGAVSALAKYYNLAPDQTLRDHFYLHCLIPVGPLCFDLDRWIPARKNFLFPVKALQPGLPRQVPRHASASI